MTRGEFRKARADLDRLGRDWSEMTAVEPVRERAHRLLEVHPLRAADALQLACALVAVSDRPAGFELVTYDESLAVAAEKEGFKIVSCSSPR